jgi:cell division protein DivIC
MINFKKLIKNRYVWVTLAFLVWLLFLDNYSYLEHRLLIKEINELEKNKAYYKEEIKKDCLQIKKFQKSDEVERFAREKYYMKKSNEDVYVIEYEDENLNNQQNLTE